MIVVVGGEASYAFIVADYPAGSSCKAVRSRDGKTLKAKGTSGHFVFKLPKPITQGVADTWTVSCTDGVNTDSTNVQITSEGQSKNVTLNYRFYIFKEGSGFMNGFSFNAYASSDVALSSSKLVWASNEYVGNQVLFIPSVDLSSHRYETLCLEIVCTDRYSTSNSISFGVGSDSWVSESNPGTFDAMMGDIYNTARDIFELDISEVSGSSEYVKLASYGVTGELYNAWLE